MGGKACFWGCVLLFPLPRVGCCLGFPAGGVGDTRDQGFGGPVTPIFWFFFFWGGDTTTHDTTRCRGVEAPPLRVRVRVRVCPPPLLRSGRDRPAAPAGGAGGRCRAAWGGGGGECLRGGGGSLRGGGEGEGAGAGGGGGEEGGGGKKRCAGQPPPRLQQGGGEGARRRGRQDGFLLRAGSVPGPGGGCEGGSDGGSGEVSTLPPTKKKKNIPSASPLVRSPPRIPPLCIPPPPTHPPRAYPPPPAMDMQPRGRAEGRWRGGKGVKPPHPRRLRVFRGSAGAEEQRRARRRGGAGRTKRRGRGGPGTRDTDTHAPPGRAPALPRSLLG